MLVVVERAEGRQRDRGHEPAVAEVVVLVFDLGRPVRGEHVFQTAADGPTIAVAAVEGEHRRRAGEGQVVVDVSPRVTALDVEQRRTPGVAGPRGGRTDRALVVVVDEAGARAGERDGVVVVAEPAVLALDRKSTRLNSSHANISYAVF